MPIYFNRPLVKTLGTQIVAYINSVNIVNATGQVTAMMSYYEFEDHNNPDKVMITDPLLPATIRVTTPAFDADTITELINTAVVANLRNQGFSIEDSDVINFALT